MRKKLPWVVLAIALGSGCYTPRRIAIPPSEDGLNCLRECMASHEHCKQLTRWKGCRERYDRCLLICPGAHEDTSPEEEPIRLPGS